MIGFRRNRCGEHQESLLDFAGRRAGGPAVSRALAHVERCERCARDLAATTLVLHALRRLHDETLLARPAGDGWERLRVRIETRRRASRLFSGMPGVIAGMAICALLAGPAALRPAPTVVFEDDAPAATRVPAAIVFEAGHDRVVVVAATAAPPPAGAVTAAPRIDASDDLSRSLVGIRESAVARPGRPATSTGHVALAMTVDRR